MKNFNYYTPTQVVFGRGAEDSVAQMVQQYGGTKVFHRADVLAIYHLAQ